MERRERCLTNGSFLHLPSPKQTVRSRPKPVTSASRPLSPLPLLDAAP